MGDSAMMIGRQTGDQSQLFSLFNREERSPARHLRRRINPIATRVLADLGEKLKPFYRETGRRSIDPELMLKMLIVGCCYGIRFERKLCEEVELGSVASLSTTSSPITRHFRSIATAASVTATSSDAWTAKASMRVQLGYDLNSMIDVEHAVIIDVEATPARTYDEVAATRTMIDRTEKVLGAKRLAADAADGTGKMLA